MDSRKITFSAVQEIDWCKESGALSRQQMVCLDQGKT